MNKRVLFAIALALGLVLAMVGITGSMASADGEPVVHLFNGSTDLDGEQYYLACSGVGKLYNGDPLPSDRDTLSCRAHNGPNVSGPQFNHNVADGDLSYEYATVTLDLYNGDDKLEEEQYYRAMS
jgi:hypothetical protein